MNPLLLGPIADIFNNLIGLGKELVVDKDKQIEYAYKVAQLQTELVGKMLTMQTTPRTDAAVKLIYATKELILPMIRPWVSAGLAIYGAAHPDQILWLHEKLGATGDAVIASIFGSFPAWMYSRHAEKMKTEEG